ncbi:MAG TPA: oligosaccharide repeat unit polymerase [Methylothermaceae bacterium]|nr:oligosaccharide repeat unit polymerase [Methylothermaceae bacterium]
MDYLKIWLFFLFIGVTAMGMFAHRHVWICNPVVGFLFFNCIMGVGILPLLDLDLEADLVHSLIVIFSPVPVAIGSLLVVRSTGMMSRHRFFWTQREVRDPIIVERYAWLALLFSGVVTVLYYQAVGYNLAIVLLKGGVADFTALRLESYAGDTYFAPGYVNQFKNTILPVTFFYLSLRSKGRWWRFPFVLLGSIFLLYALLGTGQRTFLVIALLVLVSCLIAYRRGKISIRHIMLPAAATIALFLLVSVQLGRVTTGGFWGGVEVLAHRVFASNQWSAVVGFRYVYREDVVLGQEWAKSAAGLLPGVKGSDLARQVHYIMFGSDRGTAPLSVWGSIYYNFGLLGVLYIGILIGATYQTIYMIFLNGSFGLFRVLCYAALFLYLSIWIAGGPVQLLNNGIAAVAALLLMRRIRLGKSRTAHA